VAETAMDEDGSNDSDNEMLATSASKRCASAANERLEPDRFKQKIAETDFTGAVEKSVDMLSLRNRGMSERQTSVTWGAQSVASFAVPNVPAEHVKRPRQNHLRSRGSSVPVLDPILLQTSQEFFAGGEVDSNKMKLKILPDSIRHLPADTKVEIFNRKTGRIMRGDDAILLSDLPAALMDHAEYEPIIPAPNNSRYINMTFCVFQYLFALISSFAFTA
jgi:hypothetical protein